MKCIGDRHAALANEERQTRACRHTRSSATQQPNQGGWTCTIPAKVNCLGASFLGRNLNLATCLVVPLREFRWRVFDEIHDFQLNASRVGFQPEDKADASSIGPK